MNSYDEIKETMQKLQEKIEKLEKENQELKDAENKQEPEENNKHIEILENIKNYAHQEINKIFEENKNIIAASICVSQTITPNNHDKNSTSICIKSFDEINEEALSNVCEIFTNPRRIAILKVLIDCGSLTATELNHKTGLVGGQLYHHLSNLESEQLIVKENEKYKVQGGVQGMLLDLYNIFGFGLDKTKRNDIWV